MMRVPEDLGSHTVFNIKFKDFLRTLQAQILQIQGPNTAVYENHQSLVNHEYWNSHFPVSFLTWLL